MLNFKTLAKALESILKDRSEDLTFFGKKALYTIDGMNVAEIKLSWSGSTSHYDKLVVTIQNKEHGVIASNEFIFEEYLTRMDSKGRGSTINKMYIWVDTDIDWYIIRPVSTSPICSAVFDYIEIYS